MAAYSPSELTEQLSRFRLAEIIDKLAGDEDNLKVDVQNVKFAIRKMHYEVNGTVNFNVIHTTPNPHAKPKES